ncbi:Cupredoxin, partial [Ochromonadaceae sp. CCMP2298]
MQPISLLAFAACALSVHGAALMNFTYVESTDSFLNATLEIDQFFYTNADESASFYTRVYNRASDEGTELLTGCPLIYMKRGDTVNVTVVNNLGDETQTYDTLNSYHYANVTNLHTHGLHVSSNTPQDNVLMSIEPGTQYTYSYTVPDDHAGGTHWYHAHHHGSTAIQVGGGLLGAIIVADEEDEVPAAFWGMDELVLLIHNVPVSDLLSKFLSTTGDALYESGRNSVLGGTTFCLVNGQYQPTATVSAGEWTRLRVIFSGLETTLELQMTSDSASCEWQLLARDGIYVSPAPRTFGDTMFMAPGSRADVKVAQSTILSITVEASTITMEDLPLFTPNRPNYLATVNDYASPVDTTIVFGGAAASCTINSGQWVAGGYSVGSMESGSVQRFTMQGEDKHPFHVHVNSFQLAGVTDATGYYTSGDWGDVLYEFTDVTISSYYFPVDTFVSKAVIHCHFLPHEDLGCMGYMDITGTAG